MIFWLLLTLSAVNDAICTSAQYDPYGPDRTHSDYCPKSPHCPNDTHILCQFTEDAYYRMASSCRDPINILLPDEIIDLILNLTSLYRSKVAHGDEKGHQHSQLPKGYGLRRIEWDNQLATFAQIKANQCLFSRNNALDSCYSSWRFPDPGQLLGIVRYNMKRKLRRKSHNPTKTSTRSSFGIHTIDDAVRTLFELWYSQKKQVTDDYILVYPKTATNENAMTWYLQLVYDQVSHIGCGASAYKQNKSGTFEDIILLICNFSSMPVPGQPVYPVARPPNTSECGCSIGTTVEGDECLCYPDPNVSTDPTKMAHGAHTKIALLPIVIFRDVSEESSVESESVESVESDDMEMSCEEGRM